MIVYGISTCDSCKKAIKALERAGHAVTFQDIRRDPLTEAQIDRFVADFGDRLINRQSTTYRSFSDFLKASETEAQIAAQPTAMKRPLIDDGTKLWLGWDAEIEAALT
jgi:arsenate reductase (glutaredoxin)